MLDILFYILLGMHGSIHILGFLKAFKVTQLEELTLPVSKRMGIVWLVAALLFGSTFILLKLGIHQWWILAIVSSVFSQLLIFNSWADTKFGTIPNVLIGGLLLYLFFG
ncbi:MAG: hypothetical protein OCD76_09560 [Reichenbachiella sp.]